MAEGDLRHVVQSRGHFKKEAEIGAVLPQAREHQEPREVEEARKESLLETLERARTCWDI